MTLTAEKPDRLVPPWTPIQVADLNAYQRSGRFHPFTCPNRADAAHAEAADGDEPGLLIAREDGWECPGCAYRQGWAHPFMGEPVFAPAVTAADRLIATDLTVNRAELQTVLGLDEDDNGPDPIVGTCAGEWRREGADLWRAYDHAES